MAFLCLAFLQAAAQNQMIQRIDPTNWWVGMKNPSVQLLIYGTNLKGSKVSINYAGVTVKKVNEVENPNYLFVDISIAPTTKAGKMNIVFTKVGSTLK